MNTVEEAMQHVIDTSNIDVHELIIKREAMVAHRAKTLKVEQATRDQLDLMIAAIDEELEVAQVGEFKSYKQIDLRIPLSWNDIDKDDVDSWGASRGVHLPKLAVFRLDKPTMTLRAGTAPGVEALGNFSFLLGILSFFVAVIFTLVYVFNGENPPTLSTTLITWGVFVTCISVLTLSEYYNKRYWCRPSPRLPKVLSDSYRWFSTPHSRSDRTIRRTTRFAGVIPDHAREQIEIATKEFGKRNVFLVAEANNWTNHDSPPRVLDPLIIGVKDNRTYLVGSFDLTELEEAISTEFTT